MRSYLQDIPSYRAGNTSQRYQATFFSVANDRLNSTTRHQNLTRFHPNLTTKPRQDVSSIQIITSNSKKKGNNQQAKRANGSQKKLEVKNVFHGKSKVIDRWHVTRYARFRNFASIPHSAAASKVHVYLLWHFPNPVPVQPEQKKTGKMSAERKASDAVVTVL